MNSRKTYDWSELSVAPEVLAPPHTGEGNSGKFPSVPPRAVIYIAQNIVGKPWADQFALIAAVYAVQGRDAWAIEQTLSSIHSRFLSFRLKSMDDWNTDKFAAYVKGEELPGSSMSTRLVFFRRYQTATKLMNQWFASLTDVEQETYKKFMLPLIPLSVSQELSRLNAHANREQEERRVKQVEKLVPQITILRNIAHLRFNRLRRLRDAYRQAVTEVEPDHSNLPLDFSYEEPQEGSIHCRLWDKQTFLDDDRHCNYYAASTRKAAKKSQHNGIFLELVSSSEPFWFSEIVIEGFFGRRIPPRGSETDRERQQFLQKWGYEETIGPFQAGHEGLLTWSSAAYAEEGGTVNGRFWSEAMERTGALLLSVESMAAAATFGIAALELLTTTGFRMLDLLSLRSSETLICLVDDLAQTQARRYLLHDARGPRYHFGLGYDCLQALEEVVHMLNEHYQGELPYVQFARSTNAWHRYPDDQYLFQYCYKHMDENAIHACLRFLLHGITDNEGVPVVMAMPQLLRHTFNFPVPMEETCLPIDLLDEFKRSTNASPSLDKDHPSLLITEMSLHKSIMSSSQAVRLLAEQARLRVGTLAPVCGGECTFDGYCPNRFECIGCVFKVPDPRKRKQVEEKRQWAEERLLYYEQEGLTLEVEKLKTLVRACMEDLEEMDLMEGYRNDASKEVIISLE